MPENHKNLIRIVRIAIAFATIFLAYFIVITVFIPVSRFKIKFPEEIPAKEKLPFPDAKWQESVDDSTKNVVLNLINREAFLLYRMELSESDSISAVISLKDSSVALVMQGVTIFSSKIQAYKISEALYKVNSFALSQWASKPFVVDTYFSSIPKTPVLYKKAPKDTIEAMSIPEMDPLKDDMDPVYFTLNLDRQLKINFIQAEIPDKEFIKRVKEYKNDMRTITRKDIFSHLLNFSPMEFVPEINIVIDKKAARVIYRAMPEKSLVALQI